MANTHSVDLESSSTQYLSIASASHAGISLSTNFTIEFWINLETRQTQAIIDRIAGANQGYFIQTNASGDLIITWGNGTNSSTQRASGFFAAGDVGKWVHCAIAVTIVGPTVAIYKDGASQSVTDNGSTSNAFSATATVFYIGANDATETLDGKLDDFRIWSTVRTQQQIQDNRYVELVGNEANLVGYWKFDNALTDSTSNANTLTNNNSATFSTNPAFHNVSVSDTLAVITDTFTGVLTKIASFIDYLGEIIDNIYPKETAWTNQSKNEASNVTNQEKH